MIDKNQFKAFKTKVDVLLKHYNAGNYIYVLKETERLNKKFPNNSFLSNLYGSCLQKIGKLHESIKFFKFALKIDKDNLAAQNNLGNSLKLLYEFDEAEKCFLGVLKKDPNHIQSIINLGGIKYELNKLEEAIQLFNKAINLNENLPLAHFNAGLTNQSLGNKEQANKHYNKILKINPKMTIVDRQMSRMIKYTSDNEHFVSMKKKENNDLQDHEFIDLGFALSKAYEDMSDYENAYKYLKKANDIKNNLNKTNDKSIQLSKNLIALYNKINLDNLNPNFDNQKKIIFIVGLPRSGTSLTEQILASHSKVYGCGELTVLEIFIKNLFTDGQKFNLDKLHSYELLNLIRKKFFEHIEKFYQGDKLMFTDKTPQNFMWIGIIKLIFPNSLFIHCSRNPKDNCLSIYKNLFDHGGVNWSYDLNKIVEYFQNYKTVMNYWKTHFANSIIDVTYEDMVNNPETNVKKILNFCKLEFEENCLEFYKNKRAIKTLSINQARQPIYNSSVGSYKNYEKFIHNFFTEIDKS